MYIVVDSGSTKSDFRVVDGSQVLCVQTEGINPFYQTEEEIRMLVARNFADDCLNKRVENIYFYGAGCSFAEKKNMVRNALQHTFPNAMIEVEGDLLAAARSLFGVDKGIACILGTGSNSCFYDGSQIVLNVPPLGFILGDEGSGATICKLFVAECLKGILPQDIVNDFFDEYRTNPQQLMDGIYRKAFPNRFLASFFPYIVKNIKNPIVLSIVQRSFSDFFERNVEQYERRDTALGFVGSVAFVLRDYLEVEAQKRGYKIKSVVKSPMEGLLNFHSN